MDFGSRQDILTNGSAVFIDCANERKKEDIKMSKEQELQWRVDYLKESLKQIKATIVGVKMGYANKDWVDSKMMDSFCDLIDNSLFNSK